MALYDLDKTERKNVVAQIGSDIFSGFDAGLSTKIYALFADEDTYI
jgi:hypothetical protein